MSDSVQLGTTPPSYYFIPKNGSFKNDGSGGSGSPSVGEFAMISRPNRTRTLSRDGSMGRQSNISFQPSSLAEMNSIINSGQTSLSVASTHPGLVR